MYTREKGRWLRHLDFLWIGIVICLVFSGISVCETGNLLTGIGGSGKVLDLTYDQLTKDRDSIQYDKTKDQYEICENDSYVWIKISKDAQKWKFLCVDIRDMNCDDLSATLKYINSEGKKITDQEIKLKEGHTVYELKDVAFSYIGLAIAKGKGTVFSDVSVQFREENRGFSGRRFLKIFFIAFCCWMICIEFAAWILKKVNRFDSFFKKKPDFSAILGRLGDYSHLFGKRIAAHMSGRQLKGLRCIGLAFLSMYLILINNCGKHFVEDHFTVHKIVVLAVVFLIACLCYEKEPHPVKWDRRLAGSMVCLALIMTVSDFLITKDVMWTGLLTVLFFGMFYYAWSNIREPGKLLGELCSAWTAVYLVGIIYCILFRKMESGYLYSGFFAGRVAFAMYLVIIVGIGAGRILEGEKTMLSGVVTGIALVLIWKTQRLYVFLVALVLLATAGFIACVRLCMKDGRKRFVKYLAAALCFGAAILATVFTFRYLQEPLIANTVFAFDAHKEANAGNLWELVKNNNWKYFFYNKCLVWKQYLRELNLFGHSAYSVYKGKKTNPENGYLLVAYRYGVVAVIGYGMVLIGLCKRCIEKIKGRQKGAYIALFSVLGFILLNLAEDVERPFVGINWLWIALVTGYCLSGADEIAGKRE